MRRPLEITSLLCTSMSSGCWKISWLLSMNQSMNSHWSWNWVQSVLLAGSCIFKWINPSKFIALMAVCLKERLMRLRYAGRPEDEENLHWIKQKKSLCFLADGSNSIVLEPVNTMCALQTFWKFRELRVWHLALAEGVPWRESIPACCYHGCFPPTHSFWFPGLQEW